jgi:Uma2 family endonuclease
VLEPLPPEVEQLIERRKRLAQDGYDEVWEGVYHMAPMARGQHGRLQIGLARVLGPYADTAGLVEVGPFNLGDGPDNFRVPDLGYHRQGFDPEAVYYATAAIVVEIVSPGDETYDKLPFYASHAVDEVVITDPAERRVRILLRAGDHYEDAARSALLGVGAAELEGSLRWA